MHKQRICLLALCFAVPPACDSAKPLNNKPDAAATSDTRDQADAAGVQSVCTAASSWTQDPAVKRDFKTALCRFTAFFAAAASGATSSEGLKAACAQTHAECVADEEVQTPLEDALCPLPEPCDVTSLELQTCVSDWVEALKVNFLSFPSCDALEARDLEAQRLEQRAHLYARPPSCAVVESKCPALLL